MITTEWERLDNKNKFGRMLGNDCCEFVELVLVESYMAIKHCIYNTYDLTIGKMDDCIKKGGSYESLYDLCEQCDDRWLLKVYSIVFDQIELKKQDCLKILTTDFQSCVDQIEAKCGMIVDLTLLFGDNN